MASVSDLTSRQTVKVKVTTDEAVIAAMETITDRLPDVAIYGQVYADTKLAVMMAKAYKEVVGFAVQATTYFQKHGFTRALKAIGNPTKFPDLNVELVKNFTTIRARCEALLAQRVAELSQQNIGESISCALSIRASLTWPQSYSAR